MSSRKATGVTDEKDKSPLGFTKKHGVRIPPIGDSKTVRCSGCGYNNPINAELCMKCGERLKKREGKNDTRIYDEDNTRIYE